MTATTPSPVQAGSSWDRASTRWDRFVEAVEARLGPLEGWLVGRAGGLSGSWRVVAAELVFAGFVLAALADQSTAGRSLAAVGALAGLGLVAVRDRREAVLWLVGWLLLFGTLRRIVSLTQVDPERDPMMVVAPLVAAFVGIRAVAGGALRRLTPLGGVMAVYTVLVAVAALNPRQPSVGSVLAGTVMWGLPALWFWIGRSLDDETARRVGVLVVGVGVAAAAYGILQLTVGLPAWDQVWLDTRDRGTDRAFAALYIGPDTVRPWGTSTSASGYGLFMGSAFVALCGLAIIDFRRARRDATVAWGGAAALCAAALVLSSVRSALLFAVVAVFFVAVAASGRPVGRPLAVAAVAGLAGWFVLSRVDPTSIGRDGVPGIFRRLVITVGHPFDDQYFENTTSAHVRLFRTGIADTFRRPLGSGPGSVGLAADRFGGAGRNSETDLSNAGLAFGVVGLVVVGTAKVLAIREAWRASREAVARRPAAVAALAVGVLGFSLVALRDAFNTQHWAMVAVLWIGLGWVDGRDRGDDATTPADADLADGGPETADQPSGVPDDRSRRR